METMGQRIRRLRGEQSRKELGKAVGVTHEAIRQYEADIHAPGKDTRKALADLFKVSEPYLQYGVENGPTATLNVPDKRFLVVQRAWENTTDGGQKAIYAVALNLPKRDQHNHKRTTASKGMPGTVAGASANPPKNRPASGVRRSNRRGR